MPTALDRRTFIRLLAGAAAAPLAACSADYPDEAVAAWRGPDGAADLRRWALGHAILAPNSHNRQPWLVDLREPNAIVLQSIASACCPRPIRGSARSSSARAPSSRRWCWRCAQRGARAERRRSFPKASSRRVRVDDRPVARITWTVGGQRRGADPLFEQLLRRHTAKVDYDTTRPVAADDARPPARRAGRPGRALRRDRRAGAARGAAHALLGSRPRSS